MDPSPIDTWIGVLSLIVAVVSLAVGLKKPDLSATWKTLLWILEIISLLTGIFLLGWPGLLLFIVSSVIALAATSVRMAMKLESTLVSAAIEGDLSVDDVKALHRHLKGSHDAYKWLGPIKLGELIRLLAQRARSKEDIAAMSLPIAMMLAAFDPLPMPELVGKIDRLLRLTGTPAAETMKIADTLTKATQVGAWTFMETLDALLAVYEPPVE